MSLGAPAEAVDREVRIAGDQLGEPVERDIKIRGGLAGGHGRIVAQPVKLQWCSFGHGAILVRMSLDLAVFRLHLVRSPRRYSRHTVVKRIAISRRWLEACGDPWAATVHDVERWASELAMSPTGTRDAVSHVRQFYRWAIRAGMTATAKLKRRQPPTRRRRSNSRGSPGDCRARRVMWPSAPR